MSTRSSLIIAAVALLAVPSSPAVADHHEAGEYEKALSHIQLGGNGYVADGVLASIPSEKVRQMITDGWKKEHEAGMEMKFRPEYISVAVHGPVAIATYLVEATLKESEDDDEETKGNRGTLVWQNTDNGWKIVHWHVSKLVGEDDD